MFCKAVVVSAAACMLSLGAAGVAAASTTPAPAETPPAPQQTGPWVPIFYFGTQTYCMTAAAMGQQLGVLSAGHWKCDSGWLLATPPLPTQFP